MSLIFPAFAIPRTSGAAACSGRPALHRSEGRSFALLILILAAAFILAPVVSAADTIGTETNASAGPAIVHIGHYVMDFTRFNAEEGMYEANFYVSLKSDSPVDLSDFEMVNGQADSIGTLIDTPNEKYYRVFAKMSVDPDFHRYPFDSHVLQTIVEPKVKNVRAIIFVIDENQTGLDPEIGLPGWEFGRSSASVRNYTYPGENVPYSRAVFSVPVTRDSFSTFLKFFLPVMLIIIVSLSSLLMRVTSRLGLNASMFLAAVLIHWRIADALPAVGYATFLDYFMILTYATLVMVLVSGILMLYFSEVKDQAKIELVNYWSLRLIPVVSITMYTLLFFTLLF